MRQGLTKINILLIAIVFSALQIQVNSQSFYLADAKRTGCYKGSLEPAPQVTWTFKTRGKVFSSPVIYKSLLYIGSNDSCLYALDKNTGERMWKFKTNGVISSSAAVFNDVVYINSFDGFVYALNAENGKLIWKFDTGGEKVFQSVNMHGVKTDGKVVDDPWDMYLSSPVVNKNTVYVGSGNGTFYALDIKSGKPAWTFKTNGVIHTSPALSGDSVYFASWDSYIYALNATTGKEYWKFKTGIDTVNYNQVGFQASPVISGKMLYIGCRDANMRAIDRLTGKLVWQYPTSGSWVVGSAAVYKNRVYFGTSDTHRLLSLDAATGKVIFDQSVKTYVFSTPAIAGDKLYVGTFGGFLYEMDCNTGKTRSVFRTSASEEKGKIYLNNDSTTNSAKVFANPTWEGMVQAVDYLYSLGSVMSSPAISEDLIYFGSTDGYVYALK